MRAPPVIYWWQRTVLEMRQKTSIFRKLLDRVGLTEEKLPGEPVVELLGDGRVLIENHGGVIEYGTQVVRAKVRYGTVGVVGGNLRLRQMSAHRLVITGKIGHIEVTREGETWT